MSCALTCFKKERSIAPTLQIMEQNHSSRAELITRDEDEFPAWQLWEITGGGPAYLDTTRRVMGHKCQLLAQLLYSRLCGKGSLTQILALSCREQVFVGRTEQPLP